MNTWRVLLDGAVIVMILAPAAHAQRPEAELACAATETALVYDCTVRLWRGGRPLEGVKIVAGADMPSMPLAHAVRPVVATPGKAAGQYTLRLTLEMRGEWAVKLRLSGAVNDQLIVHHHFDGTGVAPARR